MPGSDQPKTLRGCTKEAGKPDVGDCTIGYGAPVVSPNGRLVAFDAGVSLALMRLDGSHFRLLPAHSANDSTPAFSPTGKALAFSATPAGSGSQPRMTSLWVGDLVGGPARQVTARGTAPAWSSRNWIAFLRRDGVYRVHPDGHGLRRLVQRPYCTDVAWSPHGTKLAFVCRDRTLIADGDGSHAHRVPGIGGTSVAWSPSGRYLAVTLFDDGAVTIRTDGSGGKSIASGGFSIFGSSGVGSVGWQPLP